MWGSSAPGGGPESRERTPEGTPFNVGVWAGPDGESVLAGVNPGSYDGDVDTDLSKPLPPEKPDATLTDLQKKAHVLRAKLEQDEQAKKPFDQNQIKEYIELRSEAQERERLDQGRSLDCYQGDWAGSTHLNRPMWFYC